MEQRLLRLGDIVDDYCPRERRVTNHAIVAIVDNAVRQTRCSTCQSEHEYKEAKVPKKKTKGAGILVPAKPAVDTTELNGGPEEAAEPVEVAAAQTNSEEPAVAEQANGADGAADGSNKVQSEEERAHEAWLAHRPLIRATLPKVEGGEPPPRAIPEFTMHQRHGRGFGGRGFRHGHGHGHSGNGAFRNSNNQGNSSSGNDPDGNRAPQPGRPGRRRRRRRPR